MQIKQINRTGVKKTQNTHKTASLCTSCKHNTKFLELPSMKSTRRCTIYGTLTDKLQFKECKYYNSKRKFGIIIGGSL